MVMTSEVGAQIMCFRFRFACEGSRSRFRGGRFPRSCRQGRSGSWSCPWRSGRCLRQVFYVLPTFGPGNYSPSSPPPLPSSFPIPGRKNTKPTLLPSRWPRYDLADALPLAMRPLIAADRLTGVTAVITHPLLSAGRPWAYEWMGWPDGLCGQLAVATPRRRRVKGLGVCDPPWLDEG